MSALQKFATTPQQSDHKTIYFAIYEAGSVVLFFWPPESIDAANDVEAHSWDLDYVI